MSAITIIWAGKLIDTVSLKKYTLVIVLGLAITCLMASIVFNIFFLFLTIYFLRLFGLSLRYFSINRGKALAISGFGFSIGEMIYPTIVVILLITIGWRLTWFSSFLFIFIILGGSFYFLLRRNNFQKEDGFEQHVSYQDISWRRRDVLRDFKFYLYLPLTLLMSFTVTGFLFHQVFIAEMKSWSMMNLAQSFIFYASCGIGGSVISGLLVDKFTGRKLVPFHLIPMASILVVMLFSDHVYILYLYMAGLGLSNGFTENISNSLWAEIYGVKFIGSIKALTTAFMVFSTAFGTAVFGLMIDNGFSIENIAFVSGIYIVISLFLLILIRNKLEPIKLRK